jgi:hypothetical protein
VLVKGMPEEILDVKRLIRISKRADYCNVKRLNGTVKLKLRASKRLYTFKVKSIQAEELIKKLQCEIREL